MGNEREKRKRRPRNHHRDSNKINRILSDVQGKLDESYTPEELKHLNAFERKQIHRFFDDKPEYETKTYRNDGDFVLKIYPVGNIRRMAREKAEEVMKNHEPCALPPMGSFERYVVHDALKEFEQLETKSEGEGVDRHIMIHPIKFGRGLKKIIKKIKLI